MAQALPAQTLHQNYSLRKSPGNPQTSGKQGSSPHQQQDSKEAGESARPLRCSRCQFPLTSTQETAFIKGRHRHVFFNPAGLIFDIRCFNKAPGVQIVGKKSSEFTWFAGYVWQLGLCRACGMHLGWFFSGSGAFHALIADRFIE